MSHFLNRGERQSAFRHLLESEAAGGIVLMFAACSALIFANSALAPYYFELLNAHVGGLTILHWINEALMALFFLLVGLEIKREFLDGQLAAWPHRLLPGMAAAGGMIVPAILYAALNVNDSYALRGWAIPTATDIAFALGVLSLLGSRVPVSLKIFLMAIAIMDDLGAIAIIAVFYSSDLTLAWLGFAAMALLVLIGLGLARVVWLTPYLALGALLWFCVFQSGVHATLAGVVLAMTIPLHRSPGHPKSPLHRLEHALSPWVAFLIVPLFGFANAGISFSGITIAAVSSSITAGIALGLFIGKQAGVFFTTWAAVKLKIAARPAGASWSQVYAIAVLCGIGFTMSLFIDLLAFPASKEFQNLAKLGVVSGSLLSTLVGFAVLRFGTRLRTASGLRHASMRAIL